MMSLPSSVLGFLNIGVPEIIILCVVGILLFGKRLPEIGKNLGKTIVEFKKGLNSTAEEINKAVDDSNDVEAKTLPSGPKASKPPVKQIATSDEP